MRSLLAVLSCCALAGVLPANAQTFNDVPADYWAYTFVEALAASGVTGGCGGGSFCPEDQVSRAQMAVFLERGFRGSGFVPPAATGSIFADVGAADFAADWIEQLFADGITGGCGNGNYCPTAGVTRAQMAVFLLRARNGADYVPPPATGVFTDVQPGDFAAAFIEQLAADGISSGCGGGNFCPTDVVTRAQMAVFLVRTFEIEMAIPPPGAPPQIAVQSAFLQLSFSQPLLLRQAPADSTQWYVGERGGVVRRFPSVENANNEDVEVFLDITDRVDSGPGEAGLLGIAFDPAWPAVPAVYVSYTADGSPLTSTISRFRSDDGGLTLNPASEEVILTVLQDFGNHNGGNILFGPDGYLYIGLGDGGSGGDPNNRAQTTTNLLGAMLRIDVSGEAPYEIPFDNPFAANADSLCTQGFGNADCPEIFAWGLRNPWRFSFDSLSGVLWAGDVGQNAWEEIDRVSLGDNLGWRVREGAHCYNPPSGCATTFVDPVTEYDHSVGSSVTGGYVYRGSAVPAMVGWYIFGDFVSGRIFAVWANSPIGSDPTELLDTSLSIASFAEGNDGELYLVDYGGSIWQITNAP